MIVFWMLFAAGVLAVTGLALAVVDAVHYTIDDWRDRAKRLDGVPRRG